MALPIEIESEWFKTTSSSLIEHKYDYLIMPATPKKANIRGANATETVRAMNLGLRNLNEGALGCWVSHLRAWSFQNMLQRPIISLEADTHALLPWQTIKTTKWQNYDLLFLHEHPNRKKSCPRDSEIQTGLKTRYATGAMLFTGRTPLHKVLALLDTTLPLSLIHI